jgi:pyruvate/2-oxoglutarate dehydrogenase complex dihydrolipoamide dehydrogenase (E3) component
VVVGAGMGGVNAANQVASRGAKVAVIEGGRVGGT